MARSIDGIDVNAVVAAAVVVDVDVVDDDDDDDSEAGDDELDDEPDCNAMSLMLACLNIPSSCDKAVMSCCRNNSCNRANEEKEEKEEEEEVLKVDIYSRTRRQELRKRTEARTAKREDEDGDDGVCACLSVCLSGGERMKRHHEMHIQMRANTDCTKQIRNNY